MDWITSWPSVIFGSVGLLACVIGLLIEELQPEDIRQRLKKKAAASGNDTDSGKCREKHSTYNIAGGGENVNLL